MLIVQVSDIHAAPENDHLLRFDQALTWLKHLQPDILVLTGDLTDGHWHEGYKKIAARLNQQKYPSLILPGNSDDRCLMRSVWGENRWAHDPQGEALHFIHDAGNIRLIGLDSSIDSEDYGSVAGHLEWLDKQLNAAGDTPSLLFLHHHVFASGIPTLDETMCRGLAEMEDLIKHSTGRLMAISTGHVHRPISGLFAGIPAYICGSVCPANPAWFGTVNVPPANDPPALMIHHFASNALACHHICV
ncbi:metallophosphoesterase [Mangrovibacter sp. MFB070]|uniref:metallophosphoesterase n=1 Tax=Mangrovibacter sp. MFB070 TaxID=1224318 RepID=UPI0004D449B0|nr:metallophosphoesterase [Mangrovibacter sp. MFB070]KEA51393.1 metallophosphoesterase [Mangrovibacter sp. MFB070]